MPMQSELSARAEDELVRAQQELRANRERLEAALLAAGTGTFRWDVDADVLDCDENLRKLLAVADGGTVLRLGDFIARVHHKDRPGFDETWRRCARDGVDLDLEFRVVWPDGTVHWLACRAKTTRRDGGYPASMTGACTEVSRRRFAEDSNRQNAEMLRVTFEQAAVGIATADAEGRFLDANQKFADILGYTRAETRQLGFRDITHPDELAATEAQLARLVSGEVTDYVVEKRYRRKDGATIWSRTTVTAIRDGFGQPIRFVGVIEDISRRREIEDALRASEQFNRTIIESSRDCIKMLSLEGVLLWISESGCKALAIDDPCAVIGKSWIDMWHGDDCNRAREAVASARGGGMGSFVGRVDVRGEPRWFDAVVTPITGADGQIGSLLAVSRDVTERVQIERALREETRVLELLNETGRVLAAQLDVRALLQHVTDVSTELTGASFGAFFYNTTDENGDAYQLFTLSGAKREAFERFGHPRATPLFAPTFHGEAIIRCDDVRADPRFGKMPPHHGPPPGHLPVRSYLAVPVVTRAGEVLGGLFFGHPEVGVFNERSERMVSTIAAQAAISIDNARLYAAAQAAAEERNQLLERERHARSQAERMSAAKDEFLAVLSHELRTPLNAILGWAHMLRRRATPEDLAKGLEIVERNARAQTQLIDDLLDMSRITSGKMRLDVQAITPATFVDAAVEAVRPAAAAKGIRLEVMLDSTAGPISGDPSRLQQVVWNLLSNAIKFTPKDGRIQVVLERVNSQIEIAVADTGAGIDPEFIDHVFERFRQADASTTRKHGGLGLGLAIVKHLVELHGGTVNVHSEGKGQGTTFIVKLPLCVVKRHDDDGRRIHPSAPSHDALAFRTMDLSGLKVLVVDDEPDARELVARILGECGAEVVCAGSAEEALSSLDHGSPDVLVSDIGMPSVDGFELLRRVRKLSDGRGKFPAIALTAFARSEDRTRALVAGFSVHVSKPIEPSELVATVASVAGRASAS